MCGNTGPFWAKNIYGHSGLKTQLGVKKGLTMHQDDGVKIWVHFAVKTIVSVNSVGENTGPFWGENKGASMCMLG